MRKIDGAKTPPELTIDIRKPPFIILIIYINVRRKPYNGIFI